MKDGIICGLVIGMAIGALLYKYNPQAKELVNKTEDAVKKEVHNMTKDQPQKQPKTSKKGWPITHLSGVLFIFVKYLTKCFKIKYTNYEFNYAIS